MAPIFENTDLLAHTCGLLDAADIARLCQSCKFVPDHIKDVKTIKFLSTMRSDAVLGNLSTIERLALVESLRECSTCIAFKVFSCDLLEASLAPLQRFAALMQRHRSFSVLIEAHCGLEAPRDAGYIFARERGRNVKIALLACGLEPERLTVISYGNRRPLVWAFGNPSDEKDAGGPNRRVELYVRSPDGFEVPARRPADEYATGGRYSSDIGPDGPGIVDDEDDHPLGPPEAWGAEEEEPDSDPEGDGVYLYNQDPEEPDEEDSDTTIPTLVY